MGFDGAMRFRSVCLLIALGLQAEATTTTTTGTTTTIEAIISTTLITTTDTDEAPGTSTEFSPAPSSSVSTSPDSSPNRNKNDDDKDKNRPGRVSTSPDTTTTGGQSSQTARTVNQTTLPPGFATHCDIGTMSPLAIRDSVLFCVFLSTIPPKKMIFKLVVEEYGSLRLQGSKDIALGATIGPGGEMIKTEASELTDDIHVWVARSDAGYAHALDCSITGKETADRTARVSCPQIYADASHFARVLSLVVNLQEGSISSFVWDNACSACGPQRCMKSAKSLQPSMVPGAEKFSSGSCGRPYVECEASGNPCDLQILVTWAGTDRKGNHLHSAGRRLSKFGGSSIGSMYETLDYELR